MMAFWAAIHTAMYGLGHRLALRADQEPRSLTKDSTSAHEHLGRCLSMQ